MYIHVYMYIYAHTHTHTHTYIRHVDIHTGGFCMTSVMYGGYVLHVCVHVFCT